LKITVIFDSFIFRENNEYFSTYNDNSGDDDDRIERVKKETTDLIKKQLAARRSSDANKSKVDGSKSSKYSKLKAAESTEIKVNGLSIDKRETYVTLLAESLKKNVINCERTEQPVNNLSKQDFEDCAILMEYEVFSSNKVISLYTRGMARLVRISLIEKIF
jgi:hypothetical protein